MRKMYWTMAGLLVLSFLVSGCPKPVLQQNVEITGSATALKRLTTGGQNEMVRDVSPDNQWLLLDALPPAGKKETGIQKLDLLAGVKIVLTPQSSSNKEGSWLPNQKGFAFVTSRLGKDTLVESQGITGAGMVRFITQPAMGVVSAPHVSPDGKEIVFSLDRTARQNGQLAVIELDGTNMRIYGEGNTPKFSPDKKRIAFSRKVGLYEKIFVMESETGGNLMDLSVLEANDRNPTWSPRGNHLAFISDRVEGRDGRSRWHLFVMNLAGREVNQLTDGDFDVDALCWGKDGTIYFSANAGDTWDIWRLRPLVN